MLNKALRIQDIEILYIMRIFLKQLHEELIHLHNYQKNNNLVNFHQRILYRDDNITAVLIQILIEENNNDTPPFANISQLSFFGEVENEVLFSMGTVFRIENITKNHSDENSWLVQLILTNDKLCNLVISIGKYIQDNYFLQIALKQIEYNDQQSKAALHHQIAFIYHEMGHLEKAIQEHQQSLTIKLSYLSENDPELSITIANMSSIYRDFGQLDLALTYIQRAIHIDQSQLDKQIILASRFHLMGIILYHMNKIDQSTELFHKALKIWMNHLPPTHSSIAESLNNLATIYYEQKQYDDALNIYKKYLDIEIKSLPKELPSIAITHNNLACTYYQQELDHCLKPIEISCHPLGDQHSNTQTFRNTLETTSQKLSSSSQQLHSNGDNIE